MQAQGTLRFANCVLRLHKACHISAFISTALAYAEALVFGTAKHQLVNPDEPKKKAGMSAKNIARMEGEMESLERELKAVTDNYTENMFTLQTAQACIKSLLKNAKAVRYLSANHAEIYSEFETIAAAETV